MKHREYRVTTHVESSGGATEPAGPYVAPAAKSAEGSSGLPLVRPRLSAESYAQNIDTLKSYFSYNKPAGVNAAWANVTSANELPAAVRSLYERLPYDAAGKFHSMLKVEVPASEASGYADRRLDPADRLYIAEWQTAPSEHAIQVVDVNGKVVASGTRDVSPGRAFINWDKPAKGAVTPEGLPLVLPRLSAERVASNLDKLKSYFQYNQPAGSSAAWATVASANELPPAVRTVYERLPYDAAGKFHSMLKVEVLATEASGQDHSRLDPADRLYIAEWEASPSKHTIEVVNANGDIVALGSRDVSPGRSYVTWEKTAKASVDASGLPLVAPRLSAESYAQNVEVLKSYFSYNKPAGADTAWANLASTGELPPAVRTIYDRLPYDAQGKFHLMLKVEVYASGASGYTDRRLDPADRLYIAEWQTAPSERAIRVVDVNGKVVASGTRDIGGGRAFIAWDKTPRASF